MALLRPIERKYPIEQHFGGHFRWENPGYLQSDKLGPRKGYKRYMRGAQYFTDLHLGTDFGCPVGTPVIAMESGIVVAQGTYPETGEHYMMLMIHHDATYTTIQFDTHLSKLIVPTGHKVKRGSTIALTGATGHVTGPHDHDELRVGPGNGDPRLSGSWMRWNLERFLEGGDLANSLLIKPTITF